MERASVVAVQAGEVEIRRGEAEGGWLLWRGERVVACVRVAPVRDVQGERGFRREGGEVIVEGYELAKIYKLGGGIGVLVFS